MPDKVKDDGHDEVSASLARFDKLPDSAHVRLPVVTGLFDISAATAWRWSKSGLLPAARRIGANSTGWNVGELRSKLAELAGA